jgi:hypothetical protein
MAIKIANIWKKRNRKWGGNHVDDFSNDNHGMTKYKIKRHFTFHAIKTHDTLEERVRPMIMHFLHANSHIEFLKNHVRKLFGLIEYMQKRIRT